MSQQPQLSGYLHDYRGTNNAHKAQWSHPGADSACRLSQALTGALVQAGSPHSAGEKTTAREALLVRVAQPGVGVGTALSHAALSTPATGRGQALPAETERQLLGCAWKPTTGRNSSYLQQGPFSSEIPVSHTVRQ